MRRLVALRRLVVLAMIYPLMVFFLGYGLFLLFALKIAPALLIAPPLETSPLPVRFVAGIRHGVEWWGPILPTIVLTAALFWFYRSRRALVVETGGSARLFGWVPSFRRLLREGRTAAFADILALLVEHGVPLAEAIVLAAESGGDADLIAAAKKLAADITAGSIGANESPPRVKRTRSSSAIPPLLRWLIATGSNQQGLAKALRDGAETYRRRAVRRADWLRLYLPMLLTLGIGGTMTLVYAISLFIPWTSLLYDLTKP